MREITRLDGVGRRYGVRGPWVLRDLTLDLPPGALVRIEGANGTGKSTLLRIVAGVDPPTAGEVRGRPATATAYVPERFPAALPFPVLRYLTHLGAVRGLPVPRARERARHWLERFAISGYADTPLDELSKGTCQKVAVAQALLADPELLVLDEAWTGLDQAARTTLDDAVRTRVAAGGTVVFVDHDPGRLAGEPTAIHRVTASGGTEALSPGSPVPRPAVAGAPAVLPSVSTAVVIEAAPPGPAGRPPVPHPFTRLPSGAVRLTVPGPESDAALRTLLAADPPWHITALHPVPGSPAPTRPVGSRTETAADVSGPRVPVASVVAPAEPGGRPDPHGLPEAPARGPRNPRVPLALLRYEADLLLRSHRWLGPLLFYGAVMAIGVSGGQPLLGSLGYASALLVPVAAWMVRVCVTNEPPAARACVASAVGARRAQLGALVTAMGMSAVVGGAGTAVVLAVSGPHSDDLRTTVPVGAAALAGLLAAAVSVLVGTAVGALTNPPLMRGTGWSLLTTALAAGAVLVATGSPAHAAVTGLVTGSRTGTVHYPLLSLAVAAPAAALAAWISCRSVSRL
ncbi:ATP-binding cassette domain-containing protein [Streptomyces sp. NPDC051976]|uniref:ABC transporter ATP-binding protein n=1 Tax=Streptomyces sp. NPDC051976 TaxID=3154947 RepID=UPI00342F0AA2